MELLKNVQLDPEDKLVLRAQSNFSIDLELNSVSTGVLPVPKLRTKPKEGLGDRRDYTGWKVCT